MAAMVNDDLSLMAAVAGTPEIEQVQLVPEALQMSMMRPYEILGLNLPDDDNRLADRMLSDGQCLVMQGGAGVGKSTLAKVLAVNSITGRAFCDLRTFAHGKKWLFFNAENSPRREQNDMAKLMAGLTQDERDLVNENLIELVPQLDNDFFLNVNDEDVIERLMMQVRIHNPDTVVFDPLIEFFAGDDENNTTQMRNTYAQLMRIARVRNKRTAVVIVHHSQMGKAGAAAAVGWEKSRFGRGSKALYSCARAVINITHGDPDDSGLLIMACAKNNNGKQFDPRALRFDADTLNFRVDWGFSIDEWAESLASSGRSRETLSAAAVMALVEPGETLTKAELARRVEDATGFKKTAAYGRIAELLRGRQLKAVKGDESKLTRA